MSTQVPECPQCGDQFPAYRFKYEAQELGALCYFEDGEPYTEGEQEVYKQSQLSKKEYYCAMCGFSTHDADEFKPNPESPYEREQRRKQDDEEAEAEAA